jgi:ubiquitin-conjugating enzyme E2 variant
MRSAIRQRTPEELAAGYTHAHRMLELAAIVVFGALLALLAVRIAGSLGQAPWTLPLALVAAMIGADFLSGLVHWGADTWGTVETPLLGGSLIRSFREHHVDPKSITQHDFIEANGNSCLVLLPVVALAFALPISTGAPWGLLGATFLGILCFFLAATNEIHKRAHQDNPPRLFRVLQRMHVLLSPRVHDIHHESPFARYYCITTGWLNAPLTAIGFFSTVEKIITRTTGAIPRQDDIGREAALELAASLGIIPGPSRAAPRPLRPSR